MRISKKYDGTGLVFSKYLVEMHGGKITTESKFGEGSIFTFLLALKERRGI
jgi:signal transduction histidine kinase